MLVTELTTAMAQLYEFLVDAELQQYYVQITSTLNLNSVGQMKHSNDEDLTSIGMTRPEIRRLKKFLKKHGQQGPLTKLRRILTKGPEELKPSVQDGVSLNDAANVQTALVLKRAAVVLNQELGSGEFGTVHYGTWKTDDGNKMQVSLKSIKQSATKNISDRFLEGLSSIQRMNHPQLIRLYGAVVDVHETIVVTELAPMRSLADCLRDAGNRAHFPVSSLCDLAVQIADGMNYLESNAFVHRDLAARNVLVFSKDLVKISDHGLTRALGIGIDHYKMNISISLNLPIAWCAPECIEHGLFTSASDVWSYGVTLWEMFTYGFQPWVGLTGAQIASAIGESEGQRLNQPERCPKEFYDLMLSCWKRQPEERPKFAQILPKVPSMKVTRHIVKKDCSVARSDCMPYTAGDIFTLLDKSSSVPGIWKGIHESSNKTGFFSSADTLPFIESQNPDVILRKGKVNRKESDRKSLRPGQRLDASMISGPQNDLRHVGHVGYDGVTFGDVACIDILPDCPGATKSSPPSANTPSPSAGVHSSLIKRSCSSSSLISDVTSIVTSIISSDTLTDVSSMQEDIDSLQQSYSDDDDDLGSLQQDSPNEDLAEFRIPDISQNNFDLGPSLMDEIMRAIGNPKNDRPSNKVKTVTEDDAVDKSFDAPCPSKTSNSTADDKRTSPLLQSSITGPNSHDMVNGKSLRNDEIDGVVCRKMDGLGFAKAVETESDLPRKLDSKVNQSNAYPNSRFHGNAIAKDQLVDRRTQKADVRIPRQPPIGRDAGRDPRSSLSNSQSSLKNGIFSKIGSALARRGSIEQKVLYSLDALVDPSTDGTSAEFNLGARKYSATSSSSLPMQRGGFSSTNGPGVADDDTEVPSNVIHRTKERIRSSVASVIGKRSSLRNPRFPPPQQQNLNANVLFFDRLREQELENAETEARDAENGSEERIPDRSAGRPVVPEAGGTSDPTRELVSDASRDPTRDSNQSINQSIGSGQSGSRKQGTAARDSLISGRCPSVVSQDSLRISECSSLTRRSIDSFCTDDSGAAHADPVSRGDLDPVSRCDLDPVSRGDLDPGRSRSPSLNSFLAPVFAEDDRSLRVKTDEEIISSQSPPLKLITGYRSRNEEIDDSMRLVSSIVPGVHTEDCMYALSETNWDSSRAVQLLHLQQRLSRNCKDSHSCKQALEACDWDLEAAYKRLTESNSGRESPELVHV